MVRERSELEYLLAALTDGAATDRLMPGLATVASALNANDQALARIAAVHLRIPDLPDQAARDAMEAADVLNTRATSRRRLESGAASARRHAAKSRLVCADGWRRRRSFSTRTAQNDDPTHRSDASSNAGDNWVRLRPGPQRIDELADFIEWIANAKPEDERAIRAEIKRYFYDVGDQGSAAALNSALTVLLRPGITKEDRQRILDRQLDAFTHADPGEYAQTREWATGAALLAGGVPPVAAGEAAAAEQASEAWTYGWAKRGQYFDQLLRDGSLPTLFRTIDNFTDGVATSIKSIDLNAATYQDAARLTYRLNKYIDDLGDYEGGSLITTTVELPDISDRVLNLVVPKGAMTKVQGAAIEAARSRALIANRYPVKIIITPL